MLILKVESNWQESLSRVLHSSQPGQTRLVFAVSGALFYSYHCPAGSFSLQLHPMLLHAVYEFCIKLMKGRGIRKLCLYSCYIKISMIVYCDKKKMIRLEFGWGLQKKGAASFSLPVLTIVNEFTFTKGGCPTLWPHWAPHRSTGPCIHHSQPHFFHFPM